MEKINSLIKKMRFLYATKDCVSSSHYFGKAFLTIPPHFSLVSFITKSSSLRLCKKYLFDISDSLSNLKLDFKLYYKELELL